jgi:hypothetical protein
MTAKTKCPPLPEAKRIKPYAPAGGKPGHDGNPPEEVVVRGIPDPEKRARTVATRNVNHCTIFRLHHRKHLNDKGMNGAAVGDIRCQAAEKLRDDHARAGLSSIPSTLAALAAHGAGGMGAREIADMKIDASRDLEKALNAAGTSGRFLLEKIVLDDWTLEKVAAVMRCKRNAVLPALIVALDVLVQRYGLKIEAKAKIRGGAVEPLHPFRKDAS